MVKLGFWECASLVTAALCIWIAQGKLIAMRKIKRLEKENRSLRGVEKAQRAALRNVAEINSKLIAAAGKESRDIADTRPALIIQGGKGYVKRM